MNLKKRYSRDEFLSFISSFIPNFGKNIRKVGTRGLKATTEAYYLGESPDLDLAVFELTHTSSSDARVTLATEGFKLMKDSANFRALIAYIPEKSNDWRLSLMTATPDTTEKGKVILKFSNPRRYSFFLGESAKVNTPYQFLIKQDGVADFDELQKRFSLEVVNKDFYDQISEIFYKLVGGTLGAGKNEKKYKPLLKLPSVIDHSQTSLQFGVRLIGRIIFCWFLREKKSQAGLPLMPKELLSLEAVEKNDYYYHEILEPIFFEILNKPVKSRLDDFAKEPFFHVPYLNGGLFSPQEDDYYKRSASDFQSQFYGALVIPDKWFMEFFEILETYNFTIDENTSYDEELSIDPEMLGRIFENLLAEINPETGESARKSTGSYYTPRIIVNYMIDESLLLYLKEQTGIREEKLRAIISYDLSDDLENPVTTDEKEKIIEALEKVKILDPACGSGAFPMGALQKIVFILQQTDPDGQLWFRKQIENTSPEIKRIIEREFEHKNFDYIRKIGIIRENIYGIDIQPIATEISRLRCFLTLIVDESIQDNLENRGIEPLPNLDFKFVTANSLIGLPKSEKLKDNSEQMGMFDDNKKITELKLIRNEYFTSSGIEREQLKSQFSKKQKDLIFQLIQEHGYISLFKAELTQKLTDWDPFSHKASAWFDPEWMFGIKDGFDIVIANPPYSTYSRVTGTSNKNSESDNILKKELFKLYPNSAEYKLSTYALFINKGIDLLNKHGKLSFITPDSYLLGRFFSKIRKLILQTCKISTILFFKEDFWKSGIIGCPTIILLSKESDQNGRDDNKVLIIGTTSVNDFTLGIQRKFSYDQSYFKLQAYNRFRLFFDQKEFDFVKKFEDESTPLGEIASIHVGIRPKIGYEKVQSDNKVGETWHKGLTKGNDVTRYLVSWKGKYINIDPKILWTGGFDEDIVNQEKLLIRKTGDELIVAYDSTGLYHLDILHSLILINKKYNLFFLMAILNSSAMNSYYKLITLSSGRVMAQTNIEIMEGLPIKEANEEIQELVIKTIKNITMSNDYSHNDKKQSQIKEYEKQIDQLVYKLYGLTPGEIEIVEGGGANNE